MRDQDFIVIDTARKIIITDYYRKAKKVGFSMVPLVSHELTEMNGVKVTTIGGDRYYKIKTQRSNLTFVEEWV